MVKTLITAITALLVGIIVATFFIPERSPATLIADSSLEERLYELESRLNDEIEKRQQLKKQLDREREQRIALADHISELSGLEDALAGAINNRDPQANIANFGFGDSNTEQEIALLIEAGFSDYEAQRIVELEQEAQQALFNARFGNERVNPRDVMLESQNTIRSELGDDQYELYLETTGRPTSVGVAMVQEGSAGEIAGLQTGDEIISYDGERVFSILDLQQSTQTGTEGQTVIIEVLRDGNPVTLAIPRGQIGISTGGFGPGRGFPGN